MFFSYSRQSINSADIKNVSRVLKSDYLTTGPKIEEFEKKINLFCGSKYSLVVNSATSALHLGCLALGLKKNDLVWTTPISFVATSNCALHCGAKIDFVDIDIDTFNISTKLLEIKLKKSKKKPKIVIPVHLSGHPCDMEYIFFLKKKYGFFIIEDASHAIGSTYKKTKIGDCKFSDLCIFSFHPVKIITTGEGGCLLSNNYKLIAKANELRSHGILKEKLTSKNRNKTFKPWYYQQNSLGFNFRMTDIQAALGLSQLKRIKNFIKKRNSIAQVYEKKLSGLPVIFQKLLDNSRSSRHLFIIRVPKKLHLKFFYYMNKNKIKVNLHYIPIYLHSYYRKFKFKNKLFVNSNNYYNTAVSLPNYYDLSFVSQNKIINLIKIFFKNEHSYNSRKSRK